MVDPEQDARDFVRRMTPEQHDEMRELVQMSFQNPAAAAALLHAELEKAVAESSPQTVAPACELSGPVSAGPAPGVKEPKTQPATPIDQGGSEVSRPPLVVHKIGAPNLDAAL